MTAIAKNPKPHAPAGGLSSLLPAALGGVTAALSEDLSKLVRAELARHSGVATVDHALKNALPGLIERSFQSSFLAGTADTHRCRMAMLHLLSAAELHNHGAGLLGGAPAEAPGEAADLTTEEAAKMLCLSRTHVVSLVKSGALPASSTAGGHRRISEAAVLAYKEGMKARQSKGLDAMMEASADLGLYDGELEGIPRRAKRKKA